MRTEHVLCISCGSRLEIPADTRYIACHVCGTSLSVQHLKEGISTAIVGASPDFGQPVRFDGARDRAGASADERRQDEAADRTARRIGELERRLDELERENALLRLEHAWEEEREPYLIRTRGGGRVVPSVEKTTTALVVMWFFGGLFLLAGLGLGLGMVVNGGRGPFGGLRRMFDLIIPLGFIFLMVVMAGVSCYFNRKKAIGFLKAHARYQAERARILGYDDRGPRRDE